MLIRNREQQDQAKIVRHTSCAWCKMELDYPRIVVDNENATSYHVLCILHLISDITADLQELIELPDAAILVRRITTTNMMMRGITSSKQH
jgi:hypothetical protein